MLSFWLGYANGTPVAEEKPSSLGLIYPRFKDEWRTAGRVDKLYFTNFSLESPFKHLFFVNVGQLLDQQQNRLIMHVQ